MSLPNRRNQRNEIGVRALEVGQDDVRLKFTRLGREGGYAMGAGYQLAGGGRLDNGFQTGTPNGGGRGYEPPNRAAPILVRHELLTSPPPFGVPVWKPLSRRLRP